MIFSKHWSYNIKNDPKRLGFVLARYKLAKDISYIPKNSILELGCSEGIGISILKPEYYLGIDIDEDAISVARNNYPNHNFFIDNFLNKQYGYFDLILSLDVIEHIPPDLEADFFNTCKNNLSENGIVIIGTPNKSAEQYASEASKAGHINLYDHYRLRNSAKNYFKHVFMFGINDEIVHVGFEHMRHYIMAVCL